MPYNPFGNLGYPTNIQPSTTGINGVPQVSSIDEVRAASVPYGIQLFMSSQGNMLYAKNAQGTIKAFKYEEVPIPSNDPQNFVTKQEFDQLRSDYERLAQQYAAVQSNAAGTQSVANNEGNAELSGNTGTSQAGVLQQSQPNGNVGY